jgi:hypothetical protein
MVRSDFWIDKLAAVRFEGRQCPDFAVPINRLYPTTSAARTAASLRWTVLLFMGSLRAGLFTASSGILPF